MALVLHAFTGGPAPVLGDDDDDDSALLVRIGLFGELLKFSLWVKHGCKMENLAKELLNNKHAQGQTKTIECMCVHVFVFFLFVKKLKKGC